MTSQTKYLDNVAKLICIKKSKLSPDVLKNLHQTLNPLYGPRIRVFEKNKFITYVTRGSHSLMVTWVPYTNLKLLTDNTRTTAYPRDLSASGLLLPFIPTCLIGQLNKTFTSPNFNFTCSKNFQWKKIKYCQLKKFSSVLQIWGF